MDISIVVPLFNEAESLPELMIWINRVMTEHGFSHEVRLVDDGSNDGSWEVIEELKEVEKDYYLQIQGDSGTYSGPKVKIKNGK
jgi:glycosyltransferase involved in cell wall biosynthesis